MAKHVLIVDDDMNQLDLLSTVLKQHGYEWTAAKDGEEGLERITEHVPDLIVLDIMMPRKTGVVLFRQMKKSDEHKEIPVIMLTGVSRTTLKMGLKAGGDIQPERLLDKPTDPDEFIQSVKSLIGDP